MKVLLISSNSSGRGGGEKYLVFMTMGLQRLGHDVVVLLSTAKYMDNWEQELIAAGAEVRRRPLRALPERRLRFLQSALDFRQQRQIAEFCRETTPDVILVNQQYDEDALDYVSGAMLSKVERTAMIMHLPMTRDKDRRPWGRLRGWFMRRWYRRHAPFLLFSSVDSQREFFDYYKLDLPSAVVMSGVPLNDAETRADERLARLQDPWIEQAVAAEGRLPIIGVACQFVPQKNLAALTDAWLTVNAGSPSCRLLLIGDGPERRMVENRLAGAPRHMWHITGWGDKYADYLRCLDLFVMPSRFESTPLALVEALAAGIPALISRFNGSTELLQNVEYVSIWDESRETLASAIADKLERLSDDKARGLEGCTAYRRLCSPEAMAGRFLEAFSTFRIQ